MYIRRSCPIEFPNTGDILDSFGIALAVADDFLCDIVWNAFPTKMSLFILTGIPITTEGSCIHAEGFCFHLLLLVCLLFCVAGVKLVRVLCRATVCSRGRCKC